MFQPFRTCICCFVLLIAPGVALAQSEQSLVIPAGAEMQLALRDAVSSKLSEVGDEISAVLRRDVVVDGRTLLPSGTEIIGRITLAEAAGRVFKGGRLHLTFERIRLPGGERRLSAIVKSASDFTRDEKISGNGEGTLKGGADGGKTLANVALGAGLGSAAATVIILAGAADGDGFGGVGGLGGVWGASGGTAAAAAGAIGGGMVTGLLLTKGKEVRLDQNTVVRLKLARALAVEQN